MTQSEQFKCLLFSTRSLEMHRIEHAFSQLAEPSFELLDVQTVTTVKLEHYNCCTAITLGLQDSSWGMRLEWRVGLDQLCQILECDYYIQKPQVVLRSIRLAVFDMDSTLIPMEVIDELAQEAGVKEQVASITEAAMRGELDFNQSFRKRLELLKGMPSDAVESVCLRLNLNSGVKDFTEHLVRGGADIGIVSGGFEPFARYLATIIPVSLIKANHLEFNQGLLTGVALEPIVNAEVKVNTFLQWQRKLGLQQNQTLAVGDGANDCLMLEKAGIGVAYKAKPYLRQRADCVLSFVEMDALSDILETIIAI